MNKAALTAVRYAKRFAKRLGKPAPAKAALEKLAADVEAGLEPNYLECINQPNPDYKPRAPTILLPPRQYEPLPSSLQWLAGPRLKSSILEKFTKEKSLLVFGNCCFYCGAGVTNFDHFVCHARGGRNMWKNIVPSCTPCNTRKSDNLPTEEQIAKHRNLVDTYLLFFSNEQAHRTSR